MPALAAQIEGFINHLAAVRRLSPHTVAAYRADLQKLAAGLPANLPAAGVSAAQIRRLLAGERRASPATVARRLAAWRAFFDYLSQRGQAEGNPVAGARAPKKPARLPKALSPDEISAFLAQSPADGAQTPFLASRDSAMLELFYSAALRLRELTRLNLNDINLNGGVVWVQEGKGGRGRVAPVGAPAARALRAWLAARQGCPQAAASPALFVGRGGGRLSPRAAQLRLALRVKRRGLAGGVSPHVLRHSCASHFLQSSGDLRATQELLGHRNIATTQIYTRMDFQHLAAVYDKAHPRGGRRAGKPAAG